MPIFNSNILRRIQTPTDAEWNHVQEAVHEERQEADRIGTYSLSNFSKKYRGY